MYSCQKNILKMDVIIPLIRQSPNAGRADPAKMQMLVNLLTAILGPAEPPLATWTFGPDVLAAAEMRNIIGPGYELGLDISGIGLSRIDATGADLVVEFLSEDGDPPVRNSTVQRVPFVVY